MVELRASIVKLDRGLVDRLVARRYLLGRRAPVTARREPVRLVG